MLDRNDSRCISAKTATVLTALRKNLEDHADLVVEAREGYLKAAEAVLAQRIGQLREGKLVVLNFSLAPPVDHSKQYETIIKMLELHQEAGEEFIALRSADVQQYLLNDWSWMGSFLITNSAYSAKSRDIASEHGLI